MMKILVRLLFVPLIFNQRPAADRRLCSILEEGNTNELHRYLASGGDVNRAIQYNPFGGVSAPLLDIAIKHGQLESTTLLLNKGADPNQPDSRGDTPLIWAIGKCPDEVEIKMVRLLLNAGANPNLKASSTYGWTPLIWAAALGKTEMAGILLDAGADANATNNIGHTPLHLADNPEIAKLLLGVGADVASRATNGMTPADMAIGNKLFDVLTVLTNVTATTNR